MSNFESSVKVIPYSQEHVYNKLSDLSNLEAVKDRLPKDKVQELFSCRLPYATVRTFSSRVK